MEEKRRRKSKRPRGRTQGDAKDRILSTILTGRPEVESIAVTKWAEETAETRHREGQEGGKKGRRSKGDRRGRFKASSSPPSLPSLPPNRQPTFKSLPKMRPSLSVGTTPSNTPPLPPHKSPSGSSNTNKPFPPPPLPSFHDFDPRPRSSSLSDNTGTSKPLPAINRYFMDEPVGRASLDSRRPSEPAASSSNRLGRTPLFPSSSSTRSPSVSDQSRSQSPLPPAPGSPHRPQPQLRSGSSSSSSNHLNVARSNASFVSTNTMRSAALNPYDAKLVNASFASLPPLPTAPTSMNPHPAPDPSTLSNQQVYPHPSHRA